MLVTQLCPTFCDPMNCSPPGSSVRGISQARIQEWVAIPFSIDSYRGKQQKTRNKSGVCFCAWCPPAAPGPKLKPGSRVENVHTEAGGKQGKESDQTGQMGKVLEHASTTVMAYGLLLFSA